MKLDRYGLTAGMILFFTMLLPAKEIAGRLNYRICVPDQASKIELMAAQELASYLKRIYTKKIRMNGSSAPILFSVGFAPEAGNFTKGKDAFTRSGFGVFCRERQVLLTGLDDPGVRPCYGYEEGTLLSVYYFLRRYTGLKVYAPDPVHGEKITRNTVLSIPAADKPAFSFSIRGMGKFYTDISRDEMALFARKQLCHVPRWANANVFFIALNRWGKRFKDQKEMLGLYQGKRQSILYPYHLPCLTNPEVKKVITHDILAMIRKRKLADQAVIRIFSDAPFKRCECKNCSRITNNNDYFYGFILSVWNEVKKVYPKTRLVLQEKGSSHYAPPARGDLKGVTVDISTGFPVKTNYHKSRDLFRQWKERGALTTIRLYARYPKWGKCPIINTRDIAAHFQAVKGVALGQRSSDGVSGNPKLRVPYAFAALTNFIHVNCLLDVDSNVDQLIREFCSFMYPGAEKEMIAFYTWMEDRQKELGPWENPRMKCYPYEALAYPRALLEKASGKCSDPFWLNKLRTAFDSFRESSRQISHLTKFRKGNLQEKERRIASFRKQFSKPLIFSSRKSVFPLCPRSVPFASKIQDSSVLVQVKKDRLVFRLTAMEESPQWIQASATKENPDPIWSDDSFEIMIAPEKKETPYLHFAVNAKGAAAAFLHPMRDLRKMQKLSGEWNSSGKIGRDRWEAEFSVPLSLIRKICPEGRGRIGIFRSRVLGKMKKELRDYFSAQSTLEASSEKLKNYHNISTYHPFVLR